MIQELVNDFPDCKNSFEYQDFMQSPNKGNASELISRVIEDNADAIGKKDNYVRYIANRPHVEKQGSHGLFTDSNVPIDLDQVAEEVSRHQGNVWTNVLSLRREDAARLGYEKGDAWRNLLRGQAEKMAIAMKIPLEDLRWYAAFHNEGHHPHCHIVAYSVGQKPYATKQSMTELKAIYAKEIFRQERMQIYETQTRYRDDLTAESRNLVQEIVVQINAGAYRNIHLEGLLQELASRLERFSGKKVYGYLPQATRNIVNAIVDELAGDPKIVSLYDLWYEQQCQIVHFYQDTDPPQIPLSQNDVFKSVRNAVVKEAMDILQNIPVQEDDPVWDMPEPTWENETPTPVPSSSHQSWVLPVHTPNTGNRSAHRNYHQPIGLTGARLVAYLGKLIQAKIEEDDKKAVQIDRKLRRQIEEKKQAHGLRMG